MATHPLVLKLRLSREQLVHIMSQQLTMSWRYFPHSREECEKRIVDYLLDVIERDSKSLDRLYHQYTEKPKKVGSLEKSLDEISADRRPVGPRLWPSDAELIDKYFPELKPRRRKKK